MAGKADFLVVCRRPRKTLLAAWTARSMVAPTHPHRTPTGDAQVPPAPRGLQYGIDHAMWLSY